MKKIKIAILGCGDRGSTYGDLITQHHDHAEVVAVAEPIDERRDAAANRYGLKPEQCFLSWQDFIKSEKHADAVIIGTQDSMHADPAIACADLGYHILLEKPMAPALAECERITEAIKRNNCIFTVGHVMLYTDYTVKLKSLLDEGVIGEIVNIQHLEPVGFWHQAHSYVRGNWGNEARSSSMLLAKSCHDIDWIRHIMNDRCVSMTSFGNLKHFKPENKPEGAAERCIDCQVEESCPYSVQKIYLERFKAGDRSWPCNVVELNPTLDGLMTAFREGPYGKCVYSCDNDVVDHQVVNMQFEHGSTASFTMTAFNEGRGRETRIFGTKGELYGDGRCIRVYDFIKKEWEEFDTVAKNAMIPDGHGGGDAGLLKCWLKALEKNDPKYIRSGPDQTLESHKMVFAAEEARKGHRIIDLRP